MSNTGRGGDEPSRRASRPTTAAAMAKTTSTDTMVRAMSTSRKGERRRLKVRCDGPADLDPDLGVLHGHLQHLLGPADLLGGQGYRGQVEDPAHGVPALALGPDELGRGARELDPGLLAGLIHGGQRGAGETGRIA